MGSRTMAETAETQSQTVAPSAPAGRNRRPETTHANDPWHHSRSAPDVTDADLTCIHTPNAL